MGFFFLAKFSDILVTIKQLGTGVHKGPTSLKP